MKWREEAERRKAEKDDKRREKNATVDVEASAGIREAEVHTQRLSSRDEATR